VRSRKNYSYHAERFIRYCRWLSIDPFKPISEDNLCEMAWLFCHDCVIGSLPGWLSGVESFLKTAGLPRLPRGAMFYTVMAGLKNIFEQLDHLTPATPLSIDDLFVLKQSLDLNNPADAEFWFATLLGFEGLLRASEFVSGRMLRRHIRVYPWGITVMVAFSKKNLQPVRISLVARGDDLCPRQAAIAVFGGRHVTHDTPAYPGSYSKFNSDLQRRCARAGINKQHISSHSLRRGGTTALFAAGVPDTAIMAHGRWCSLAYRQYIDFEASEELQQLPTSRLLQATFR
jgi:integrase